MSHRLHQLSAAEAARRIARGELTSEALVKACLERISAREDTVRAWAFLDAGLALEQARALDRASPRSLLHGVPVGIKDVIDTCDMPTEYNSPIYRGHRPKTDAASVSLLRRAGCITLGKTVTTEFANSHPSGTRNPHNPAHTPGGSSSGSAAAVGDQMVPLALGTQTGGSTILPASFCGAVCYKPSFATVNRAGLKFVAESLDTIGVFARSVEDLSLCIHVLSDRAVPDFGRSATRAPRIGFFRTSRWNVADEAARVEVERLAAVLAKAGGHVVEFAGPAGIERLFDEHDHIMAYESARALGWEYQHHSDLLSASLRARVEAGWALPREVYDGAHELGRACRRQLAEQMRDYDFLFTPGACGEAPAGYATTGSSVFNRVWTLLGVPCVTLPTGKGPRGLPLGVQFVGHFDQDSELLYWAHWVERQIASVIYPE
jgi:Asp-tRNA(Asn)/Glu-tRNA(Gln) amidotransferase A subunit family amidase